MSARPKIGFALGSGGARGWAHLGVLRTLFAWGIRPDVVAGASIGALIGAMIAAGRFEAFEREVAALNLMRLTAFFVEVRLWRRGMLSGRPVMEWLGRPELLGASRIETLPLPFAAVATDLYREEPVMLRTGRAVDAVRASIAIPGVFDPVVREGRVLVDGGLTDPVPVAAARALGADIVIAVDVNDRAMPPPAPNADETPPSLLATLIQTERLVENTMSRITLERAKPDVLIRPRVGGVQTLDFIGGRTAVEAGAEAARAARHALQEVLPHVFDR